MRTRRLAAVALALFLLGLVQPWKLDAGAQGVPPARGVRFPQVRTEDLREWLTYLSSDDLLGRQVFTEGYGLAAAYVADHLKAWGVKPLGPNGSYFQPVRQKGYRATVNSSVTVEANGQSRTFKHGDHVTFPASAGGRQTIVLRGAEFVGYGLVNPSAAYDDFKDRNVRDALVLSVVGTPAALVPAAGRGRGGAAYAVTTLGAKAAIAFVPAPAPPAPAQEALAKAQAALAEANIAVAAASQAVQAGTGAGRAGRGGVLPPATARGAAPPAGPAFTTVLDVNAPVGPQLVADEVFFEAVFAGASPSFADLRAKAARGEPLPAVSLPNVTVTIAIDNTYEVVSSQITKNVVGTIEGTDPTLKDTYVLFGAHLDHVGYNQLGRGNGPAPGACRQRGPAAIEALTRAGRTPQNPGRRGGGGGGGAGVGAGGRAAAPPAPAASDAPFDLRDVIYNGADDDGSGSVAVMAIAKAFATGPKPKRSVVFIWHAFEEGGLQGARYNADFPVVPLDKVQAQLNIDMIGRDDCNNVEGDYTNSVFVVGADRISTDLHNLIVESNAQMARPLTLDYELNDPNDPEGVYTRSDHYAYASKGVPIAFFTTGLHPDYHRVSDTVDKIVFPKMTRITQLIYQAGFAIANSPRALARDRKGPRTGFGTAPAVLDR